MDAHTWTDSEGFGCLVRRFDPNDAPMWRRLDGLAGEQSLTPLLEEFLRLAAENRELKAERDEAMAHAVGLSQEITALHVGERRRQIELLIAIRDSGYDATADRADARVTEELEAKLAKLRAEEEV